MSRGLAAVFVALAGCQPVAAPPEVSGRAEGHDTPPRLTRAERPPDECALGLPALVVTRREHSTAVALCQIAPVNIDARRSMKVLIEARSPEMVTAATLRNGGEYRATWTHQGLQVMGASGKPFVEQSDDAREVRQIAASVVGWPAVLAGQSRGVGQEAPELVDPVRRILDLQIRGEPVRGGLRVRFRGSRTETWGDALVFEVVVDGEVSSAGMCHRWASETHAAGELVLRADNGAVIALTMRGTSKDTEGLCQEGAREMGVSAEPKICTAGETTFDLRWSCSV